MAERKELRKEISLASLVAITAGSVIGAGIFFVTGMGAEMAGSFFWLSYLFAAFPCLLVGLSTAMLSQLYHVEGGESYVYPSRILSKFVGFLSGWGMWLALIGPIAITAKVFIIYFNQLPFLSVSIPVNAGAIVLMLVFGVVNYLGIKTFSLIQNVLFGFLLLGGLIFFGWSLPHISINTATAEAPHGFGGIVQAISLFIFVYAGLTLAADFGEEVKDPEKNIPRGILIGLLIPTIWYTLFSFACAGVAPWQTLAKSGSAVAEAAKQFMGPAGLTFVILVAFAAILTSHNALQGVGTRVAFGLSRDKIITGVFTNINKFGIPSTALFITLGIAAFLIIGGTLHLALQIVNVMFLFNWVVTHLCVLWIIVGKRYPELYVNVSWKLDGWKLIVPVLGTLLSIYFMVLQGKTALLYSLVWFGVGTVVYFIAMQIRGKEIRELASKWPRGRYF